MARFNLNIDYPIEKMDLSRRRMEARAEFCYVDRVPVLYGVFPRYFAALFHLPHLDFFKDAKDPVPRASFQAVIDAVEEFGLGEGNLPQWRT